MVSWMELALFVLIGIVSGSLIGLIGTGAGLIIIPALVFLAHFNEKTAVGTSLTMLLLPVGFFAAYTYWQHGNVNLKAALFIMLGFIAGSFLAARFATGLPVTTATKIFGIVAILIGIKMLLIK
jgi:uncharacterized protein